jgi:hypothetical protein
MIKREQNSSCSAGVKRSFDLLTEFLVDPSRVNPKRHMDTLHFEEFRSDVIIPLDSDPIFYCFSGGTYHMDSSL